MSEIVKQCSKCHKKKTLDQFCKNKCKKDGLNNACKICAKLQVLAWRIANPEKYREMVKNRAKRQYKKQMLTEAGRAKRREYAKQYYLKNIVRQSNRMKLWHQQHERPCKLCDSTISFITDDE